MAILVNPYNGKSVNVPDDSVATFKGRGFVSAEPAKPRTRGRRTTNTEE